MRYSDLPPRGMTGAPENAPAATVTLRGMGTLDRKHIGAHSELIASSWLLKQGYEVFRNVSQHGVVDIIAMKDGKTMLLDVKSASPNAMPKSITEEQDRLGVKILTVYQDDSCEILELIARKTQPRACLRCGKTYDPRRSEQQYCSKLCRHRSWLRNNKKPLPPHTRPEG